MELIEALAIYRSQAEASYSNGFHDADEESFYEAEKIINSELNGLIEGAKLWNKWKSNADDIEQGLDVVRNVKEKIEELTKKKKGLFNEKYYDGIIETLQKLLEKKN